MMKNDLIICLLIAVFCFGNIKCVYANKLHTSARLVVGSCSGEVVVPSTLYGIFFEDINFAADGGLYAELVKNRSFEFQQPFMGWKTSGNVTLFDDGPFDNNPHYVRLASTGNNWRLTAIQNEGFCGIGYRQNEEYRFSIWARLSKGEQPQTISVELGRSASNDWGQAFSVAQIEVESSEWKKYSVIIKSNQSCKAGFLRVFLESKGCVDLEHVSLFPVNVWKRKDNGLRKDLVEALVDLKPGVFRFPGGCIVEGLDLATRYQWKKTLGPVENRPQIENRWHFIFKHRYFPDYYQSNGIGFYEYFVLAEELGAKPLPILNCGLICQYVAESVNDHVPMSEMNEYVQDALDLIEFANGSVYTHWGSVRAKLGHSQPFGLEYIGIGNEQWGSEYVERLNLFVHAIQDKYPNVKIVGSSGPKPDGPDFNYLWPEMKKLKVDLVDEHFYKDEFWFKQQVNRYDDYDRNAPKVFAGEYACHLTDYGRNCYNAALVEAAFMTGIDRNSDVVEMATYAPLFAHVDAWQWRPDLIWFDNQSVVRTSSYYVQKLFSQYKGTKRLSVKSGGEVLSGKGRYEGIYSSAVWDDRNQTYIIKVVNLSAREFNMILDLEELVPKSQFYKGELIELKTEHAKDENSIENPFNIVPVKVALSQSELKSLTFSCSAQSLSVFILFKK